MKILSVGLILILFTACVPLVPRVQQAPQFKEKGEAQAGGYISPNGLEGQYARAITDKFYISADLALALKNENIVKSTQYFGLGAGFGRYYSFRTHGTFSLYTNLSFVNEKRFNTQNESSNTVFYLPAIGADLGVRKPKFEFVASNRLNYYLPYSGNGKLDKENWLGYETAFTFRFGGNTKFQFQLGSSFPLTNQNFSLLLPFASTGLVWRIPSK